MASNRLRRGGVHEQNVAPRETFAVNLARGDTVIYRGRELAHYRDALPDGRSSTSFFLHHVHRSFAGSLEWPRWRNATSSPRRGALVNRARRR